MPKSFMEFIYDEFIDPVHFLEIQLLVLLQFRNLLGQSAFHYHLGNFLFRITIVHRLSMY